MKTKERTTVHRFWMATLITIAMSMSPSCEKDAFNSYGFDTDFGKNASGLTVMSISNHVSSILFSGDVFMDSGEMLIEFIDPDGFIVYSQNFFAPGNYFVYETFKATIGVWKLRYTSLEGSGSIDIHATYKN